MTRALPAAVLLGLALGACTPPPPKTVRMVVRGSPPDATVTVDDQVLGALAFVASRGVALPPGKHRISVEKAGHFPWDRIVEAREGSPPLELDVRLEKIPD